MSCPTFINPRTVNQPLIRLGKEKHQFSKATGGALRCSPQPPAADLCHCSDCFSRGTRKKEKSFLYKYTHDKNYGSFQSACSTGRGAGLSGLLPGKPWENRKVPRVALGKYCSSGRKCWCHCCRCPMVLHPGLKSQLSQVLAGLLNTPRPSVKWGRRHGVSSPRVKCTAYRTQRSAGTDITTLFLSLPVTPPSTLQAPRVSWCFQS